jgi:hypothetical protein
VRKLAALLLLSLPAWAEDPLGQPAGKWELIRQDAFESPELDRELWNTRYFGSPNTESFEIKDGVIHIRMASKTFPKPAFPGDQGRVASINTQGKFAQQYGFFEVRARSQAGSGMHSAFWLVPADRRYERIEAEQGLRKSIFHAFEVDIFEQLGQNPFGNMYTVHAGFDATEGRHVRENVTTLHPGKDLTTGFHVYGLRWTKQDLTWYLDGQLVMKSTLVPHAPFNVLLDLYENAGWTGPLDPSTPYPKAFSVDYFRVWREK